MDITEEIKLLQLSQESFTDEEINDLAEAINNKVLLRVDNDFIVINKDMIDDTSRKDLALMIKHNIKSDAMRADSFFRIKVS
ncbi:MAG: hypothetical protein ACOCRK_07000 [bacterium]